MYAPAVQPVAVDLCVGDQYLDLSKSVYDNYCFKSTNLCWINHVALYVGYETTLLDEEY